VSATNAAANAAGAPGRGVGNAVAYRRVVEMRLGYAWIAEISGQAERERRQGGGGVVAFYQKEW